MAAPGDSGWARFLRQHPWIMTTIASIALSGGVTYLSREVLAGLTTGAFLATSVVLWIFLLGYTAIRVDEPIGLMAEPHSGRVLGDELEDARVDFMREIGTTVVSEAYLAAVSDEEADQRNGESAGLALTKSSVEEKITKYSMEEETLLEVEALVQTIGFIRGLRSTLSQARILRSRMSLALALWWPVAVTFAFFVTGAPQDSSTAAQVTLLAGMVFFMVWIVTLEESTPKLSRWGKQVLTLHDLKYEELKERLGMMASEAVR